MEHGLRIFSAKAGISKLLALHMICGYGIVALQIFKKLIYVIFQSGDDILVRK